MATSAFVKNIMYKTGPDEKLMAIDVYKDNVIKTVGTIATGFESALDGAINNLLNGKLSLNDLKNIEKTIKGVKVSTQDLMNRLNSQFGQIMNTAVGIQDTLKDLTLEKFADIAGLDLDILKDVLGNEVKVSEGTSATEVRELYKAINQTTGTTTLSDIVDLQAKEAFSAALLDEAVKAGLTDGVTQMMAYFDDPVVANQYLTASIHRYLETTTLDVIALAVTYIGGDAMLVAIPKLLRRIVASYRYPSNATTNSLQSEFERLVGTLNSISPTWHLIQFGEISAWNASVFVEASEGAKKVFLSKDTYRHVLTAGNRFKQNNIKTLIKSKYPKVAI